MDATSALLLANHRIMEFHKEAEQARLAAEVRRSGRPGTQGAPGWQTARSLGQLTQRIRRVGRAFPRAIAG